MSDVLTASVSSETLYDRPIIGFSPWVYPRSGQGWDAHTRLLTWMNVKSILFRTVPRAFRDEIDRYTLPGQLAGRIPRGPAQDAEVEALRVAMLWADDVQKASVHFISARPGAPGGFTGNAYSAPCAPLPQPKPFSTCAWASYLAELVRYMKVEQSVPIHVLHVIDEPRWVYRHNWEWWGLPSRDALWAMWPQGWAPVYVELDRQLRERQCRAGINLTILSDVGHFFPKNGVPFDDVKWLYSQPDVAAAGDGLGLVYYASTGGRDITQLITDMRRSLASAGWPNRQIFFKDVGGKRSESLEAPLTARGQFDYGLDALGAMLRAARMGVDFYGQYFWLRYDDGEPEFAVEYANGTFAARYTLHLFALFTRTQERGAVRLRDTTSLPPRVSFLTLESPRTGAAPFRSHYFVNESAASVPVDFTPSRPNALWRYSVDFAVNRGLTMQEAAQPLTGGRARFTLAPNSAAVLTERQLAPPLNWTPTV